MRTRSTDISFRWIRFALAGLIAATAAIGSAGSATAHEGHAPLPSTGATVEGDTILLSEPARKTIGMKTAKISLGDLRRQLRVNAHVELPWRQHALATSLVPGKVERVLVKPGETVEAGQELARIESLELETLQLDMLQAAAEVKLLRRIAEQRQGLADRGVVTGKALLETQTELEQKESQLGIALRKLQAVGLDNATINEVRSAEEPVRFVSISSPRSGVVQHADVRVGQTVETTDHLFDVVDLSTLWIVGDVLENDVSLVQPGLPVAVTFSGLGERTFGGTIDHLRLKMDPERRTFGVVVAIDNPEGLLRPGMFGRMAIEARTVQDAIVCPTAALIESGPQPFVLVRRSEGKYARRPVTIGMRTADRVEILKGLFPGDQVVTAGTHLLSAMLGPVPQSPGATRASEQSRPISRNAVSTTAEESLITAQAVVELPTSRKLFATSVIEGRIARILVTPSQPVRAGDVLAEIDSQMLRTLQLELLQAHTQMKWSETTVQRLEPLARQGVSAAKELWQAQTELKTQQQSVASLTRKLELLGLSTEQIERIASHDPAKPRTTTTLTTVLPVRAPADGWVASVNVVPGQVVRQNDQLFEIHDHGTVWVKAYVPERDAGRVHVGQEAVVTVPSYPDLRVAGTIVRTAPNLVDRERVLPVWVEVENPENALKEGMLARVTIRVPKSTEQVAARRRAKD